MSRHFRRSVTWYWPFYSSLYVPLIPIWASLLSPSRLGSERKACHPFQDLALTCLQASCLWSSGGAALWPVAASWYPDVTTTVNKLFVFNLLARHSNTPLSVLLWHLAAASWLPNTWNMPCGMNCGSEGSLLNFILFLSLSGVSVAVKCLPVLTFCEAVCCTASLSDLLNSHSFLYAHVSLIQWWHCLYSSFIISHMALSISLLPSHGLQYYLPKYHHVLFLLTLFLCMWTPFMLLCLGVNNSNDMAFSHLTFSYFLLCCLFEVVWLCVIIQVASCLGGRTEEGDGGHGAEGDRDMRHLGAGTLAGTGLGTGTGHAYTYLTARHTPQPLAHLCPSSFISPPCISLTSRTCLPASLHFLCLSSLSSSSLYLLYLFMETATSAHDMLHVLSVKSSWWKQCVYDDLLPGNAACPSDSMTLC